MSRNRRAPGRTVSLWDAFREVHPVGGDGELLPREDGETYWRNAFYLVMRKELEPERGLDGAVRLSMRREDGKAIREWKHIQRVKNEIVGPEREAVEIFPPQSMVTDMSHEHHLFVVPVGVASVFLYEHKMGLPEGSAMHTVRVGNNEDVA